MTYSKIHRCWSAMGFAGGRGNRRTLSLCAVAGLQALRTVSGAPQSPLQPTSCPYCAPVTRWTACRPSGPVVVHHRKTLSPSVSIGGLKGFPARELHVLRLPFLVRFNSFILYFLYSSFCMREPASLVGVCRPYPERCPQILFHF